MNRGYPCGFWRTISCRPFVILIWLLCMYGISGAHDANSHPDMDAYVRAWYASLKQPDNPVASCCGEADAVFADSFEQEDGQYVAIITDGKGIIPVGTKIKIPNNKIKWDAGNPTGHGIVFIGPQRQVYCYITPGGV